MTLDETADSLRLDPKDFPKTIELELPEEVFERDGPFDEFKQDASIISVELNNGEEYGGVLVLYPNYIIAVEHHKTIPFDPRQIVRAFQTENDRMNRTTSVGNWTIWSHPWKK